jgi:hypothetical protein
VITTIAYNVKDSLAALRLGAWMSFLDKQQFLKQRSVLLVPSRNISRFDRSQKIVEAFKRAFGAVTVHIPDGSIEKGWPISANFMFTESLNFVEKIPEDMLWIEPDAVPLVPTWLENLEADWGRARAAGKEFMGAVVPPKEHMTGNAVYGRNWRQFVPKLGTMLPSCFDLSSAALIRPHMFRTALIQEWWKPRQVTTKMLLPASVLFHQCKKGELIAALDQERYGGEFARQNADLLVNKRMGYFQVDNALRTIRSYGFKFQFLPVRQIGSAWEGVYQTMDIVEIEILNQTSGVREISPEDYGEKILRQKAA